MLQKVHILDTNAFECVLGTDFLNHGPVNGILVNPPRLVVNDKQIPLREEADPQRVSRLFRIFSTENYKLRRDVREQALLKLGIKPEHIYIDLFANDQNAQDFLYCKKGNCAWSYDWSKLLNKKDEFLWANPPFSKLLRTLTKVAMEKTRMVIITPDWGNSGQNAQWRRLLDRLTVKRIILPAIPLYEKFGNAQNLLPAPQWS